jgi:hypothetical protein
MVDFNEIINDIITEIELENFIIIDSKYNKNRACVDLDYLRHHPKLKDARIFRLIMGFESGMWKKPEYDRSKYCKIFEDFNIHIHEWRVLKEFLNNGCILGKDDDISSIKLNTLQKISTTFGGIPSIDKYLFDLSQIKEEPIYNPQKPSEDYKDMYDWAAIDTFPNGTGLHSWSILHSQKNGWSTCDMQVIGTTRTHMYARKPKK